MLGFEMIITKDRFPKLSLTISAAIIDDLNRQSDNLISYFSDLNFSLDYVNYSYSVISPSAKCFDFTNAPTHKLNDLYFGVYSFSNFGDRG